MKQSLTPELARVFKRLHYPFDVMLMCVRWYVAYGLSVRNLEDMMAERGIEVDHSTVHRWAIKLLPVLGKAFRRRKRPVGKSWRVDETYIKVKGAWKYLYRAVDKAGHTVESCYEPIATRLQHSVTLRNRLIRTASLRR
jgi:putative transposase